MERHYASMANASHGNDFRRLVPLIVASMFVKLKRNCKSVIEIFWDEVFIVRNKVKKENLDV